MDEFEMLVAKDAPRVRPPVRAAATAPAAAADEFERLVSRPVDAEVVIPRARAQERRGQPGFMESLPGVPEQLLRLLASGLSPTSTHYSIAKAIDYALASEGNREAAKRSYSRGIAESMVASLVLPGGAGLAGRAALGAIGGGGSAAIEAAATGEPVAPAAIRGGVIGGVVGPALGAVGDVVGRAISRRAGPAVAQAIEQAATAAAPSTPADRVTEALTAAKPLRGEQEAIYRKVRGQRIARARAAGARVTGEQGHYAQLGALKGEIPKVEFETLRGKMSQSDIDALFEQIRSHPVLGDFDKINTGTGLLKLFGKEGGAVPTRSEIGLLNEVFGPAFTKAVLSKRALTSKLGDELLNVGGSLKSLMATADLSAPLRQGAPLIGTRTYWRAFGDMFRYAGSEKAYQALNQQIMSRPTAKLMRSSGLALTELGELAGRREEQLAGNLIEKIPGLGLIARGSNRAYTGFLNKLRADTFDNLMRDSQRMGLDPDEIGHQIAEYVNTVTGRSGLGKMEHAATVLNAAFFSPRYVASRLKMLNPRFYLAQPAPVRKAAIRNLVAAGSVAATALGLAKLMGAQVGSDPRSADFGKIKIGNTRYDVLAGFQQPVRIAAQLVTGKVISSTTGKEMTLGEGYKPTTRLDIIALYGQSKEAPLLSLATTLLRGQSGAFQPVGFQSPEASDALSAEVMNRFVPLFLNDAADVIREWGPARGIPMAIPGAFGVGTQTYGPKNEPVVSKPDALKVASR